MEKLATIIWSIVPRKVEQSKLLNTHLGTYQFDFIWMGKHFKGSVRKESN